MPRAANGRAGAVRALILLVSSVLFLGVYLVRPAQADVRGADYFTNLTLITSEGKAVKFFDDVLKDRIVAVNFFYTSCTDLCSLSTARMAQIYEWLGERMGRDVFFVSITLDPETDTPERLARFSAGFDIDKGWTFLTGSRENIDIIRSKLGERARALNLHRTDFVIGNARTGVWRRSSVMGSLVIALQSILELDPDYQSGVQVGPAALTDSLQIDTEYDLSAHPGEAIFLRSCASCHTIGLGKKYAPDLAAVTVRRDQDWLRKFIMDPDLMLAAGDPVAVLLDQDYPDVMMPNLGLGPQDADDLMSYLAAADARLAAVERDSAESYSAYEVAHGLGEAGGEKENRNGSE
ncbi:MAG: SCO family protein [Tabrizicola sp.]